MMSTKKDILTGCVGVDVQAVIERPYLYILGQSKSSDVDQSSYTATRLEDLNSLHHPTYHHGTAIYDVLGVFSGDGPARQFEAGHQRGGKLQPSLWHFSQRTPELGMCTQIYLKEPGVHWNDYWENNVNLLSNLKKNAFTDELEVRGIDTYGKYVEDMKDQLVTILHGIHVPPVLFSDDNIEFHPVSYSKT